MTAEARPPPGTDDWAVVVGATGALGTAILRRLRDVGLPVVAVARSAETLEALGADDPGVIPCAADIGTDEAIAALRAAVPGFARMVVHVAGLPVGGPLETVDLSLVTRAVDLKVNGLLRLVRGLDEHLGPGSRVVAVGGHYGFEPAPHAPLAGIANAALANLVRQLSVVLGPRGVTVHLVAPGPVETERMERVAADAAARRGVAAATVMDEYRAASPLGRLTTVDEVAWAVAGLLAPEADALHGSTLALDGGRRRTIG